MTIKPPIKAAIGPAAGQLELSLRLLNLSELTENQRFHLRMIEELLLSDCPLIEEEAA